MLSKIKEVAEKAIAVQNKLGMEAALNEIVSMCDLHNEVKIEKAYIPGVEKIAEKHTAKKAVKK